MNYKAFENPDNIFRGTDFWMLNGDLTEKNIVDQLHEMKDKGVYSFIARTYLGLKSDYPGPKFKEKMKLIIDTSKELGLKVFLQAGYMPEAVLDLPENAALRYIYPVKNGEENGRNILCKYGNWSFVEHNSVTFLDMFDPDAMDHYIKVSYEEMWKEFSDEYGKTVMSIWVDEPSYNASYLPWTPKLEKIFSERWGYSISEKVWMLFFDADDAFTVRYHYRVIMRDLLEENYFKKIEKWCHAHDLLFSGHLMREETMRSQISRAQACMPYYKYFDIPGIDVLKGDMNWVDDPLHSIEPTYPRYVLHNTVTQCVSAAKQAGKEHILAEMYGVAGENFTFRNMTHMFDSYAASGINHRSVHGIFYTLHGRGKRAYPPHISYYQPFWAKYKNITDYCARVSQFISEGVSSSDIAVIHPLETGYMLYSGAIGEKDYGGAELGNHDRMLYNLLTAIRSKQRQVDFADLASIRDMGHISNGRFCVGKMSYSTVILPDLLVVTPELLKLLEDFAAQGGKIIVWRNTPCMIDGFADGSVVGRINAISQKADSISELLDLIHPTSYVFDGIGTANLLVNHRICDNGERFFICNKDCTHEANFKLSTKCLGELCVFDAYSGKISKYPSEIRNGTLVANITLAAGDSILLSTEPSKKEVTYKNTDIKSILNVIGDWLVEPLEDNALLLEFCRFRKNNGEFSNKLPIMAVQYLLSKEEYRGEITLRYEFDTKSPLDDISLALEDPTLQSLTLDGSPIVSASTGYFRDRSFEVVHIGNIGAGHHVLEITREFYPLSKVTNALTQLFETRHGIELEPMYLLGKFTVNGHQYFSENGSVIFERDFVLNTLPSELLTRGELTSNGFPFYTGEILLTKEIYIPDTIDTCDAALHIGVMNAGCGEVFVNGINVGDINRAPHTLPIGMALNKGINTLQIKLYTTLYNIIGPFHRPLGNVGNTFGGGYNNPDAAWLSINTSVPDWEKKMNNAYQTWTDRYNVAPLGIKDVYISF